MGRCDIAGEYRGGSTERQAARAVSRIIARRRPTAA